MKLPCLIILCGMLWPASLWSQMGRGYFRAGLGPAFTENTELKRFAEEPVSGATMKYDTGIQFNFAGGYRFLEWAAVELESGIIFNSVQSVDIPSSGDLEVTQFPFLANLVFEVPTRTPLIPYAGAGFGGSSTFLFADHFHVGTTTADGDFSDFVFAYQAFAGLRYAFSDSMSVSAGYRFFHAEGSDWEPEDTIGTHGSIRTSAQFSHLVTFAFTFSF